MRFFPFLVKRFMLKHIRQYKPDLLFIPFPEVNFFIPCYQVAMKTKIPYYVHMHDLWEENFKDGHWKKKAAQQWEERILRNAKRVFCMTDVQMEFYKQKYGLTNLYLLPHSVTDDTLKKANTTLVQPTQEKKTILFVGTLSDMMNMDALKVYAKAGNYLPEDVEMLFCTSAPKEYLDSLGISNKRMKVQFVSRAEAQRLQSASHVLLAPLSHKNGAMDEVRTVFSTKLLEYMVSGRPILVFAPADSYHSRNAREGDWAYVVDKDDPEKLAEGIIDLLSNESLCKTLVANANEAAKQRKASIYADRLLEWVKEDTK
jgi:glycosyltransferase involved in cell wall biosynthesis